MPAPFLLRVRPLSSTLICLPTPSTVKGAINHRLNGTGLRTETSWVARTLSFLPYHVHILSYMLGWRKACFQAQWRGLMNGIFPPQEGNEDFLLASSSITVREHEHGHTVQSLGTWWQQIPQKITVRTPSSTSTVLFYIFPPLKWFNFWREKQTLLTLMCWFVYQIISVRCWLIMFLVVMISCVLVLFNLFFLSDVWSLFCTSCYQKIMFCQMTTMHFLQADAFKSSDAFN